MADPHDIDIAVEDAPPSSGEVPNPPDPGGGMTKQGGNHESGGDGLGSGHSGSNWDVADRLVEEIVPDDGGEGHGEPVIATTLPGALLSAGLRRASSFSETGVRAIQKKWKRSVSLHVINWEDSQFSARYANGERNCKKFQLVEADHDGAWFKAIEANDHVSLWRILKGKEDDASRVALCLDSGEGGRTALHVAAMQGCFGLAKQLIDLICHAYDPSGILERPSRELNEFTGAEDGRCGQTALEMAKDISGNTSISEYIRYVRMEPQEKEKYGGMFEAYPGAQWDTALAQGDCDTLQRLLHCNSRFLLQTCSTNGLSVLDVAIMKDDDELVETVVRLFVPGGDKISWPEESCFPSELTWEQLAVRHFEEDPKFSGRFGLKNLAKVGVPNAQKRRSPGPVTSAMQLAKEFGSSIDIDFRLSKVGDVDGEEVKKVGDVEVIEFVEAEHDGAWFKAIEARDCLSLMTQLQSVHAEGGDALCVPFCYKTGEGGRTALHVAAMQGCFRLAKQLIDLICEKYPRSENLELRIERFDAYGKEGIDIRERLTVYLSKVALDFTRAKDGRSGLTAFEMANDIIGNTSISQYMLHVGMKPEEKERYKYGGMYEAYQGTEWHTALVQGDCSMLRTLLGCNSRFLLQTCSTNGLSVLDVAIMKDDKELVKMVVRAFGPRREKTSWAPESYFPSELTWEQIARFHYDEDSRFHELSSCSNYAKLGLSFVKTKKSLHSVRSAQDLAEKFGSSIENKRLLGEVGEHVPGTTVDGEGIDPRLLGSLSEEGVFKSGDTELLEPLLPELGEMAYFIQKAWKSEWTAGFLADVDYNFEDKSSLRFSILRFHYAGKHYQLYEEFIGGKVRNNRRRTKRLVEGLYAMCDSQGRTPFHTVVDHYNDKEPFEEVIRGNWSISSMVYKRDARGRSPILRAVTKQFLERKTKVSNMCVQIEENILSEDLSTFKHQIPSHHGAHSLDEWLFLSTILFQNEHVLRFIIENNEASILKTLFDGTKMKCYETGFVQIQPLLIAAALGNQAILRLCLKIFNPMIEDEDGKTALHYAADRNLFKYFSLRLPLFFYCSIGSHQKVEDQWMGRHKDVIETQSNKNRDIHQKIEDQLVERGKDEIQSNRNQKTHQGPNQNSQSTTFAGRRACVLMLRQAGVDLSQEDKKRNIPDPGFSTDASFRIWWYDTLDKDAGEKKNSFNQAGNALSVVGTLVAATSYIGPLQPPLSYDRVTGYVETSKLLVKVFMVSNTLAFYLAVASVMFAVVPSLPMPQEGVLEELKRAQQTVASSLFLLLASIGCILVSFAAASAVVVEGEHYYGASDLLLKPSIIGWFFCLIAMAGFFIRVMRLVFYKNSVVRRVYKFSFSAFCKKIGSCTIICSLSVLWWIAVIVSLPVAMCKRIPMRKSLAFARRSWPAEYETIKAHHSSGFLSRIKSRVFF